eukprot:CAMPEP_0118648730 /NCGR_PEP_ID=MMETSP0785-20121206/9316_1 /TAXON_ID=91992 /ORGANISM="Bolidomonas pacifica, Strain CCMP 1866" /LENGTH=151 /DNA_ID=CAMNT_0006540951 /DNA_START=199 /DNA_END=651 /DNA_ORIENTATION=-
MVSLPVAIMINERMENNKVAISLALKVVWILIPTLLLSLVVFFITIEKNYRVTFYSRQTGKGMKQELFKNGKDDATRAVIFNVTRHYWVGIENDMKRWVQQNWKKWEKKKPEWFTDNLKARIPVEWIPTAESRKRESERRLNIRRPSLLDS